MSKQLERLQEQYWKYINKAKKIEDRIIRLGGTIKHPMIESPEKQCKGFESSCSGM